MSLNLTLRMGGLQEAQVCEIRYRRHDCRNGAGEGAHGQVPLTPTVKGLSTPSGAAVVYEMLYLSHVRIERVSRRDQASARGARSEGETKGAHQASTMSASAGTARNAAARVLNAIRIVVRASRGCEGTRERLEGAQGGRAIARADYLTEFSHPLPESTRALA